MEHLLNNTRKFREQIKTQAQAGSVGSAQLLEYSETLQQLTQDLIMQLTSATHLPDVAISHAMVYELTTTINHLLDSNTCLLRGDVDEVISHLSEVIYSLVYLTSLLTPDLLSLLDGEDA